MVNVFSAGARRFYIAVVFLPFCAAAYTQTPVAAISVTIIDNFSGAPAREWAGTPQITDGYAETKAAGKFNDDFGNGGRFAKLSASEKGESELVFTKLSAKKPAVLSFRYRTEISVKAGQSFKIFVDDKERLSREGLDYGWRIERLTIPAGDHKIRFVTANKNGTKIVGGYNSVYIDDITVFPDETASIAMNPRGDQHTFVGAEGSEKLRFKARALYADGSVKADAGAFAFTAENGEVDKDGLWTPSTDGVFSVKATLGEFSITSGRLFVHKAGYLHENTAYPGTGKIYRGFVESERSQNAQPVPGRPTVIITNPRVADFDADAYFLLEGSVFNPAGRNYARVFIRKEGENGKGLYTWYIVRENFARRIWLPFGPGLYTVEIIEFEKSSVTTPPGGGEGMFRGGSYSKEPLTFTVNNIRDESEMLDGDGRWIYPSFNIQSDDFRVQNLLNDITDGIRDPYKKIEAIHDYLVGTLAYDTQSFSNAARSRRMDAVSVIENGTGVCDGYTNLSAALLRASGIPAAFVMNKSIMHSWNRVWADDAWALYDATWDDPVPDRGKGIVKRTYFLTPSLSGGDNRHRGEGTVLVGDLE